MLDANATALATRCLWSLQEAAPEIEGLLFTHVGGLTLTSTMQGDEVTQRLAAVATAMFLLSEHTSEAWGSGEAMEVLLTLKLGQHITRYVSMKPVGMNGVLIAVHRPSPRSALVNADMNTAAIYLESLLQGDYFMPPPMQWQSR